VLRSSTIYSRPQENATTDPTVCKKELGVQLSWQERTCCSNNFMDEQWQNDPVVQSADVDDHPRFP